MIQEAEKYNIEDLSTVEQQESQAMFELRRKCELFLLVIYT